MKRIIFILLAVLVVACTTPSYPGVDYPSFSQNTQVDKDIIAYIDQRLEQEYYWLDEVKQKSYLFDREYKKWNEYFASSLNMLETNMDDGYVNDNGRRSFYSYITEYQTSTRAEVSGLGIVLHYTVVFGNSERSYYYFIVDHVYPDSPADKAGIKRGDLVTKVDGGYITDKNYAGHFTAIQANTKQNMKLSLKRQTTKESFDVTLDKSSYDANPVAYSKVIDAGGKKIGYLAYISFDYEYDEELLSALQTLAAEGAQEVVLDLRINRGGSVNSAVVLCSALMPQRLEGGVFCRLERNPNNMRTQQSSVYNLTETGSVFSLDKLTVICSNYSASASELVVMGLRGLDVPVTLIGSQTEGKNCGMDVTRKNISGKYIEFAPITFMCFDAKGCGDWGEGIVPDVNLNDENNRYGLHDDNYPMPRCDWGDVQNDLALKVAIASITGVEPVTTRQAETPAVFETIAMDYPVLGIRHYAFEAE